MLSTVAEYGRRWEALAVVTLDPYRPALIKMQEERRTVVARHSPLRGGARMRWRRLVSLVALVERDPGGPGTYHVSVGTDDTSIKIRDPVVIDLFDRSTARSAGIRRCSRRQGRLIVCTREWAGQEQAGQEQAG